MKTSKIGNTVKDGVGVALGIALAKILVNKVDVLNKNPIIGAVAQIVGASVVQGAGKGRGITAGISQGMAANAMVTFLQATAPDIAKTIGLAGMGSDNPAYLPGASVTMPGVLGLHGMENAVPRVSVR